MKRIFKSIIIIVGLLFLYTTVHAQSYVHDWPVENLQPSAETLRQLEHQHDDIPYYLQNRTFRDTTYDTTTWQTLEDIEYVYLRALGAANSYYCVDVEILDDESVIIPWYQYIGDGLHITKVDSLGEEIYTNVYDNISSAQFHIYRKDTILEFVGNFEINGKKRFGLLKYSLLTNDTISVKCMGSVSSTQVLGSIHSYQIDSSKYVLSPGVLDDYIYIYDNDFLLDSVCYTNSLGLIYYDNENLFLIDLGGSVSIYDGLNLILYDTVHCDFFSIGSLINTSIYIKNRGLGIIKLDNSFNQIYYAKINDPGFAPEGVFPSMFSLTTDGYLLAAAGINMSNWLPAEIRQGIGIYMLNNNGVYLNKLFYSGANFYNQQIFEFKNGDYLVVANADENSTGNGTVFLMRMKPWTNVVGVQDMVKREEFSIYPNPAINHLNHNMDGIYHYYIYNLNGQLVLEGTNKNKQINIDQLHTGGHLLIIRQNNRRFSKFFIKN